MAAGTAAITRGCAGLSCSTSAPESESELELELDPELDALAFLDDLPTGFLESLSSSLESESDESEEEDEDEEFDDEASLALDLVAGTTAAAFILVGASVSEPSLESELDVLAFFDLALNLADFLGEGSEPDSELESELELELLLEEDSATVDNVRLESRSGAFAGGVDFVFVSFFFLGVADFDFSDSSSVDL